jgi:hypothetical protein
MLVFTACARPMRPVDIADDAMRSIETGNLEGTATYFNKEARATMTPASVHALANVMHLFGEYQDVRQIAALEHNRYDLEAVFDLGSMLVQMRLDPDGKIAALHVIPNISMKKTASTGPK